MTSALTFVNYIPDGVSNALVALAIPLTSVGDLTPSILCAIGLTNPIAGAFLWLGIIVAAGWILWFLRPHATAASGLAAIVTAALVFGFQIFGFRDSIADSAALASYPSILQPPRRAVVLMRLKNSTITTAICRPVLRIRSVYPVTVNENDHFIHVGSGTRISGSAPLALASIDSADEHVAQMPLVTLLPGASHEVVFTVDRHAVEFIAGLSVESAKPAPFARSNRRASLISPTGSKHQTAAAVDPPQALWNDRFFSSRAREEKLAPRGSTGLILGHRPRSRLLADSQQRPVE